MNSHVATLSGRKPTRIDHVIGPLLKERWTAEPTGRGIRLVSSDGTVVCEPLEIDARGRYRWTVRADALLGAVPDTVYAILLGCSTMCVLRRRNHLGIPATRAWNRWNEDRDRLTQSHPASIAAQRLGVSEAAVRTRRCRMKKLEAGAYSKHKALLRKVTTMNYGNARLVCT